MQKGCSRCGFDFIPQEVIPALHKAVLDKGFEATCEANGLSDGYHCQDCGKVLVKQEVVDALGHTEVIDKGYDATNEKEGLTEGSHCLVCNKVLVPQEIIPKLALIGDVDGDGNVTVMDATYIQRFVAQIIPQL